MNKFENNCVNLLNDLIENHGVVGVKISFEDEGATFNEAIRLKEICNQAKTKLTLKIGGPEALRDIQDSQIIGVKGLVAPMIESGFALNKFVDCVHKQLSSEIISLLQLSINVESIGAWANLNNIFGSKNINKLSSITFGRVDFVSSIEKDRNYVDSDYVYEKVLDIFQNAKNKGLKTNLGGAISIKSLDFLTKLNSIGLLDKFETRYVIYDTSALKDLNKALQKGQEFELNWLLNKKEMHGKLSEKDDMRIKMINERIRESQIPIPSK